VAPPTRRPERAARALEKFTNKGTRGFAERELAAIGERVQKPRAERREQLTAQ
jgi:hypothetical protein